MAYEARGRPQTSKPDRGVVSGEVVVRNQKDETALTDEVAMLLRRRRS